MGVRGLLKYIRSDQSTIKLDKIMLFKRHDETVLLACDLIAVFYWLIGLFHKAKVSCKDYSQYSAIYGGNFKDYKERILEFVQALRFINVEPVFFWDGPHGSSYDYKHKLESWKRKSKKVHSIIEEHAKISNYQVIEIQFHKRFQQTLLFDELVHALRDVGVTVNVCEGEADNIMAQYAREHKEVCTILTNDTDIALMSGVSMVHYKFFDRKDALELSRPVLKCGSHDICCDIMKPEYLTRDLKIDEKCLPALSILCGNDFTKHLNDRIDLNALLAFSPPFIASVSLWIKQHENDCKSAETFLDIKQIREICENCCEYSAAVLHSYDFYLAEKPVPQITKSQCTFHDSVVEKVINNKMDPQFLSLVKNGVMWLHEIEQIDKNLPCIHDTLQPVRKLLYRLLCISCVTEYRQSGMNRLVGLKILVNPCKPETLSVLTTQPLDVRIELIFNAMLNCIEHTIRRFGDHNITKHKSLLGKVAQNDSSIAAADEPKDAEKIKEHIGAVLTCASILFAIKNKQIPEKYTDPVIMACFCCAMDEPPQKLAGRPGPTGITIAAQFMVILKHARLLASLLDLEELLPLPSTIFQPFIYIPLHGTAFKISQKDHFHKEDMQIREFYDNISQNKSFIRYKNLITSGDCCYASVVNQYLQTKAALLDHKTLGTHKSIKSKKK